MSTPEMALVGPEIEVAAKATRRRFTVEYKRKIVREADACKTPGAIGALLRREGLYSSHLTTWRAARERGDLAGAPKKCGPARRVPDPRDKRISDLERESTRWRTRAERAEALADLQEQVAAVLGTPRALGGAEPAAAPPRAPHHRDDDVPRDGYAVLACAGRGRARYLDQ